MEKDEKDKKRFKGGQLLFNIETGEFEIVSDDIETPSIEEQIKGMACYD